MAETVVYQGCLALMRASTGLVALVSSTSGELRVRPFGRLKQNEVLPAVTMQRLSARRWPGYGGEYGYVDTLLQVDSYADTQAEALAVAEQVRLSLRDKSWAQSSTGPRVRGTFLRSERDWYEDETASFRVLQQWNIHTSE